MRFTLRVFFSRNLDTLIDIADEYIFHGKLEKIIEVTYSYREISEGCYLNETIFEDYLGLKYPEYSIEKLCLKYKFKIGLQILQIESLIKKSRNILVLSRQHSLRRTMFIEALEYIKTVLEISRLGADFEQEKALGIQMYGKSEAQKIIIEIEKKEKTLFGEKIIDSPREYSLLLEYMKGKYKERVKRISKNDTKSLDQYINKIEKLRNFKNVYSENTHKKNIIDSGPSFFSKEILRKDYRVIFDSICGLYGLPQRTIISSAGSIYDGDNFLEIPKNSEYSYLKFINILKLISHEIESHYINIYNHNILIGKFRGAQNLPKEEGIAMFMEEIFQGYSIDKSICITPGLYNILLAECFDGKDYKNCKSLLGTGDTSIAGLENSLLRIKRNYSFSFPGSQHKDVSYTRGLFQTVDYIKNGGEFYKLFLGKVGFHDLDTIDLLYQQSKHKKNIIFPLFISDLITFYLEKKENDNKYALVFCDFYMYLKKKYWFLDIERFDIQKRLISRQKNILKLLQFIEKIIFQK